ncbi:LysR family transcriptional regulator [Verticiella sediminum]|uniref:LysR family transcriptional regulator n=1 Tax=Verticiella sediminum TaxID=1247510 RepID=A0A556AKL4_9BURK|nr:LysR family transcriptional regulator [Verticiella sediminum]TSH93434.1 LysR family transcriptional regulator [Verticiella sediminum]
MADTRERFIPPLNPLRFFDVVARTHNLTTAARELNVTQSAVSRQIAVLESYLGVELFRRSRHGVKLTPAGARYAERILPAFLDISSATNDLVSGPTDGALRVRTYTTFATQWLLPRLAKFEQAQPGVQIDIVTGMRDVDFTRDNVHVSIQSGIGEVPEDEICTTLFHDVIDPVCAPSYCADHLSEGSNERLRLLFARYSHADWEDWLARSDPSLARRMEQADRSSYSISLLAWRAASQNLGIAMGQLAMLTEEIDRGDLIRPFGRPMKRDAAYRLLRPRSGQKHGMRDVFCDWLLNEAASTRKTVEQLW